MNRKRKANEDELLLGFKINDEVIINRHYFANHSMQFVDLGKGAIQGMVLDGLPKLMVRFPAHPDFFAKRQLHSLLEIGNSKSTSILISIYPGYLDKVIVRSKYAKTGKTIRRTTNRSNSQGKVSGESPKFS